MSRRPDGYSRAYEIFLEAAVARLRRRDPAFDPEQLTAIGNRLWDGFARGSLQDRDLSEPLRETLQLSRRFGKLAPGKPEPARLIHLGQDGPFDVAHVWVGTGSPRYRTVFWTLARPQGAPAWSAVGLHPGPIDEPAKPEHEGLPFRDFTHLYSRVQGIAGQRLLEQADPCFSRVGAAVRSAQLFARHMESLALGDAALMKPFMLGPCWESWAEDFERVRSKMRLPPDGIAFPEVNVHFCLPVAGADRLLVSSSLPWYGRRCFLLTRRSGVRTRPLRALAGGCAACGAPDPRLEETACLECGAALNDPGADWVVEESFPWDEGQTRIDELRTLADAAENQQGLNWRGEEYSDGTWVRRRRWAIVDLLSFVADYGSSRLEPADEEFIDAIADSGLLEAWQLMWLMEKRDPEHGEILKRLEEIAIPAAYGEPEGARAAVIEAAARRFGLDAERIEGLLRRAR